MVLSVKVTYPIASYSYIYPNVKFYSTLVFKFSIQSFKKQKLRGEN